MDCGCPPSLPYADIASVNKTTYGSKVVYSCWPGFVIERGNWIAVCNSRKEWEWKGGYLMCKGKENVNLKVTLPCQLFQY